MKITQFHFRPEFRWEGFYTPTKGARMRVGV
jgi:hypothetical protein